MLPLFKAVPSVVEMSNQISLEISWNIWNHFQIHFPPGPGVHFKNQITMERKVEHSSLCFGLSLTWMNTTGSVGCIKVIHTGMKLFHDLSCLVESVVLTPEMPPVFLSYRNIEHIIARTQPHIQKEVHLYRTKCWLNSPTLRGGYYKNIFPGT